MKQNQLYLINNLRSRIKKLETLVDEPHNYKLKKLFQEKCEKLEKRVEALEDELHVHYIDEAIRKQ